MRVVLLRCEYALVHGVIDEASRLLGIYDAHTIGAVWKDKLFGSEIPNTEPRLSLPCATTILVTHSKAL